MNWFIKQVLLVILNEIIKPMISKGMQAGKNAINKSKNIKKGKAYKESETKNEIKKTFNDLP